MGKRGIFNDEGELVEEYWEECQVTFDYLADELRKEDQEWQDTE